ARRARHRALVDRVLPRRGELPPADRAARAAPGRTRRVHPGRPHSRAGRRLAVRPPRPGLRARLHPGPDRDDGAGRPRARGRAMTGPLMAGPLMADPLMAGTVSVVMGGSTGIGLAA